MRESDNIIVGLDVGTTEICVVVAEIFDGKEINIVGYGTHPSTGLRKGYVVNIVSTVESIRRAIEDAENSANCGTIKSVYVSISGEHISGNYAKGNVHIKGDEVTKQDVESVIENAKALTLPPDRRIIHVIPQQYSVGNMRDILNPVGMSGKKLEVRTHIITASDELVNNIVRCCNRADLKVCDIASESFVSGMAVLTEEEKELGCIVINIGGGTTNLAYFKNKSLHFIYELSLGGNIMTKDLSIGLRTPLPEAEDIKIRYGTCVTDTAKNKSSIAVKGLGGRNPQNHPMDMLPEILGARVDEMFKKIKEELEDKKLLDRFPAGIIITGGSVHLRGIIDIIGSVFKGSPIRIGIPDKFNGKRDVIEQPEFATATGLVLFGLEYGKSISKHNESKSQSIFRRILQKLKELL